MATAALPIEPIGAAKAPDTGTRARSPPQNAAATRDSFIVLTNVSSTDAPLARYCWKFQAILRQFAEPSFRLPKFSLESRHLKELSSWREHLHSVEMSKSPRVIFKPERIAEGDWQIQAQCPGTETAYIKGFQDKLAIDDWLAGDGKIKWLRARGYAK
jgi:hypothetical protein